MTSRFARLPRVDPSIAPAAARVLVCGAGGFIGGHLVERLLAIGHRVRAVDIRPLEAWHQIRVEAENLSLDLRKADDCRAAVEGAEAVYNFASDMGGIGFIERNRAECMVNVLINTHLLLAAKDAAVNRYFFASSACVYRQDLQAEGAAALREADAYPAMPEDGYGWEKLFGERMCRNFSEDFGLPTRVARFHNVYGPHGTWRGGREKAPAAICRKVLEALRSGDHRIEIWGDGTQARSFTYIEDAIDGVLAVMGSDLDEPVNVGSSRLVTIDELVDVVERVDGVKLRRTYHSQEPRGVMSRNSDNTLIKSRLGWEPGTALEDGIERTYRWIAGEMSR